MRIVDGSVFDGTSAWLLNPCNQQPTLYWGTHVSEHVHRHAGEEVRRERRAAGKLPLGGVCVTTGGRLHHRHILHLAVMNALSLDIRYLFGLRRRIPEEVIRTSLDAVWACAQERQIPDIDIPCFWGGKNGWSEDAFARVFGGHALWTIATIHRTTP